MNLLKQPFRFVAIAAIICTTELHAQQIQFEKTVHDFGAIVEEKGSVTYEFKFTNTGNAPLVINNVVASCGCTTPGWSGQPIAPGKSGFVKAEFNPINRPGSFSKTLQVESNSTQNPVLTLYIKGNVNPRPRTLKDDYPEKIGAIRFKTKFMSMGVVKTNQPFSYSYPIVNESEKTVSFKDQVTAPPHLKVSVNPKTIGPGQKATLSLEYNAKLKNDYGYVQEQIQLFTDEAEHARKDLIVVATIEDYFPPMTAEQLAQAPKLSIAKTTHDFGKVKEGEQVSVEIEYRNTGKEELQIRKIKADCGCTIVSADKYLLKPGETGKFKVNFNSKGRFGKNNKNVTIFSNDPKYSRQAITLFSEVTP